MDPITTPSGSEPPSSRKTFRRRAAAGKIAGLRWWIITLVFFATVISYLDRLTVAVLAPVIIAALHLSNLEYAGVNTWFLLTYSLGQGFYGKLHDRIGTRRGFASAMTLWSLAESAHAWARSLFSLSFFRFFLGLGEAGHWPAATKSAAEWFPARQRALGMGIVNAGAALGSALSAPLIVWLELRFGWRSTFLVTGGMGFLWVTIWLLLYRLPEHHPRITPAEREFILAGQSEADRATPPAWRGLLAQREVWGIVLARFFGDPVWFLYLFWLPLYLHATRGFTLAQIGMSVWIPYLAADAGSLLGGWSSGWLISRGWTTYRARGAAILLATALALSGLFIAQARSPIMALALISVLLFSFQFWVNNVQTLPSDLYPTSFVGSIAGLTGAAGALGAGILTLSTGWVVDHFSYRPMLIATSWFLPIGTLLLALLVRPRRFRERNS